MPATPAWPAWAMTTDGISELVAKKTAARTWFLENICFSLVVWLMESAERLTRRSERRDVLSEEASHRAVAGLIHTQQHTAAEQARQQDWEKKLMKRSTIVRGAARPCQVW